MSLSFVVDMNLSPEWVSFLLSEGYATHHWSEIGDVAAEDDSIMRWALVNRCVVVTHDLDFTTTLALTNATGPSVVQVRSRRNLRDQVGKSVLTAIRTYEADLRSGAILTVDVSRSRVRILPIGN